MGGIRKRSKENNHRENKVQDSSVSTVSCRVSLLYANDVHYKHCAASWMRGSLVLGSSPFPEARPGQWCLWRSWRWGFGTRGCCCCWLSGPDQHLGWSPSWPGPPQPLSARTASAWSHPAGPPELWLQVPLHHSGRTQGIRSFRLRPPNVTV